MSNYIESPDNQRFKAWLKLLRHKYRERQQEYLIEGSNILRDALGANAEIKELLICYRDKNGYNLSSYVSPEMAEALQEAGVKVFFLSEALFDRLQDTENGRDVIAVVKMQGFENFDDVRAFHQKYNYLAGHCDTDEHTSGICQGSNERSRNVIVLDRLQDPGNIGTIIRTCDGSGFMAVIVMKGTADVYSSKVIRSAAGSLFRIPIIRLDNSEKLLRLVRDNKLSLVATGFDTDNYYFDEKLDSDIALVIGNEGGGISKEIFDSADRIVKIPMCGEIDSLNAAVSAGIIMYESMRQRKQAE